MKLISLTPNIMVHDVNKTVEFYRETLGFTLMMTAPEEGKWDWAMVQRDEAALMFQTKESFGEELPEVRGKEPGGTLAFFIKMEGVHDLYTALKDRVELVMDMRTTFYGMDEFAIRDCNGYILVFAEPSK